MSEQRRHQRVRFNVPPFVRLGQAGKTGLGRLENLSLGGLMVRSELPLKVGEAFGCNFSIMGPALIDISAVIVSCLGEFYSARFQPGPVSEQLLKDEIAGALSSGKGSILSLNKLRERQIMRVAGGLNGCLSADFMHGLKVNVVEIDLSQVTDIDQTGAELCRIAAQTHHIDIIRPTCPVSDEIATIAGWRTI
jgi:hypothetical protein